MLIRSTPDACERDVTDRRLYLDRRSFIEGGLGLGALALASSLAAPGAARAATLPQRGRLEGVRPNPKELAGLGADDELTPVEDATS